VRRRTPATLLWLAGGLLLAASLGTPLPADFRRGDADGDGRISIADAVFQLKALFGAGPPPDCADAMDTDDDGALTIADVLRTLHYLFLGGEIPSPGPLVAGPDPTCDALDCRREPDPTPAIVISEIHYNPAPSQRSEFVELHNRSRHDIDAGGLRFTSGIDFVIPPGTVIPAGGFLLVLKEPGLGLWRNNPAPRVGPYEGYLDSNGERLSLADGDCPLESVRYRDRPPWPVAPDGSGRTLERVDYLAPAGDPHSWRGSTATRGTPGAANSTLGTPAHPVITYNAVTPEAPRSTDPVSVRVTLDAPPAALLAVRLRWEEVSLSLQPPAVAEMKPLQSGESWAHFEATLPPAPSQTLVRMSLEVELADGRTAFLPHPAEPGPFLSYFVYDQEMESRLPILWLFPPRRTGVVAGSPVVSGAVIKEVDIAAPFVFDGALLRGSRNGQKLTFLRGKEYRGDRTLNIIPEQGGGGTGIFAPHMEHLGFQVFRELGMKAPHAEWYRVVDNGSAGFRNTQRLLIQQIGERFLALNGFDPSGDLYKYVYTGIEKHTNIDSGMGTLNALLAALQTTDAARRRAAVLERLDLENVGLYSVVNLLIANWDGFHNNFYLYHDLTAQGRWIVIPWDLDQVFEPACATLPPTRPITGEGCNAREPGPVARAYHLQPDLDQAYRDALRSHVAAGGWFRDTISARIDAVEALLNEDLDLQEAYLGVGRAARRSQIRSAYGAMRTYVANRLQYLSAALR
jgi:hypothetical protein